MARVPLVFSAHPSAWTADGGECGRTQAADRSLKCYFCGQPTVGWQEVFHLNDDHADNTTRNVVWCCTLCHLPQHLNRPEIDAEAIIVWLPEMAQPAVNLLVRHLQMVFVAHGQSPTLARDGYVTGMAQRRAQAAYQALAARSRPAAERLGTTSPHALGEALLALAPADYARRAELLKGLRLLPLGALYRGGHDVYPDMLRSWVEVDGGSQPNRAAA